MSVTQSGFSRKQSLPYRIMYVGPFSRNVIPESRSEGQGKRESQDKDASLSCHHHDLLVGWSSKIINKPYEIHPRTMSRDRKREVFHIMFLSPVGWKLAPHGISSATLLCCTCMNTEHGPPLSHTAASRENPWMGGRRYMVWAWGKAPLCRAV